jgi:hypothetical protein
MQGYGRNITTVPFPALNVKLYLEEKAEGRKEKEKMKQGDKKLKKKGEGRGDKERKISGVMNHGESERAETSGNEQKKGDNIKEDKITPFCCLDPKGKTCGRGSGQSQLSEHVLVP